MITLIGTFLSNTDRIKYKVHATSWHIAYSKLCEIEKSESIKLQLIERELQMNCYNVSVKDINGNIHNIGVMCEQHRAGEVALKSLKEGQHLDGNVVSITQVERI